MPLVCNTLLGTKLLLMNVRIRTKTIELGTYVFSHIWGRNQDCHEHELNNMYPTVHFKILCSGWNTYNLNKNIICIAYASWFPKKQHCLIIKDCCGWSSWWALLFSPPFRNWLWLPNSLKHVEKLSQQKTVKFKTSEWQTRNPWTLFFSC